MKLFYTGSSSGPIALDDGCFDVSRVSQSIFCHTISKFSVSVFGETIREFVNCDFYSLQLPLGLRLARFFQKIEGKGLS